jgi:hypothetical protein
MSTRSIQAKTANAPFSEDSLIGGWPLIPRPIDSVLILSRDTAQRRRV